MASAEPMERFAALADHPAPRPRPEWVARVHRDVTIGEAEDQYEPTIANSREAERSTVV